MLLLGLVRVPQGAILSPMMYNVFVADMPKSRINIIFADDVSKVVHSRYKQRIQEYVEEEIFRLNAFEKKVEDQNKSTKVPDRRF